MTDSRQTENAAPGGTCAADCSPSYVVSISGCGPEMNVSREGKDAMLRCVATAFRDGAARVCVAVANAENQALTR